MPPAAPLPSSKNSRPLLLRKVSYEDGPRVAVFDDAAARKGGCLMNVGCKGPVTHNACSKIRWNQGVSFPIMAGHGCIGCSEPDFWDRLNAGNRKGFYVPLRSGSSGGTGARDKAIEHDDRRYSD